MLLNYMGNIRYVLCRSIPLPTILLCLYWTQLSEDGLMLSETTILRNANTLYLSKTLRIQMDQDEMTWHKGLCLYVSDPKLLFHTHTHTTCGWNWAQLSTAWLYLTVHAHQMPFTRETVHINIHNMTRQCVLNVSSVNTLHCLTL